MELMAPMRHYVRGSVPAQPAEVPEQVGSSEVQELRAQMTALVGVVQRQGSVQTRGSDGSSIRRAGATFRLKQVFVAQSGVRKSRGWIPSVVARKPKTYNFRIVDRRSFGGRARIGSSRAACAAGGRLRVTTSNRNAIKGGGCCPFGGPPAAPKPCQIGSGLGAGA
uniref:Uncharacterized protein n=1 Tax=Ananas comosus var. bracteatus TaxID=296719 RepID=A0A6V7NXT8_ANACO|nr:unnamed protein product [Ananas comosus var. bracteatus]